MSALEEINFSRGNQGGSMEEVAARPGLDSWVVSQKAHLGMDIRIHSVCRMARIVDKEEFRDCVEV